MFEQLLLVRAIMNHCNINEPGDRFISVIYKVLYTLDILHHLDHQLVSQSVSQSVSPQLIFDAADFAGFPCANVCSVHALFN